MTREELAGWLRLSMTPGVGNTSARKLLAAFGLPDGIFGQSIATLSQVVSASQAASLRREPDDFSTQLDKTLEWLKGDATGLTSRKVVPLGDVFYPSALLTIEDPPFLLYMLGQFKLQQAKAPKNQVPYAPYLLTNSLGNSIAIVGSRNPTPQGAINARQFARSLHDAGLTIVSGLALGIDAQAHEGALESVSGNEDFLATIAVVGTGLDRVYPKSHLDLARRIAQHGLMISEYPLGTPPLPENFPRRNRLISGLARGTLVVEATLKSGSLITARMAAEQGKDVFAIPGSIQSIQSRGCHSLIKQGAKLVETSQDVLEELGIDFTTAMRTEPQLTESTATELDLPAALIQSMGFDPVSLEALQARSGLATAQLQAQLMELELEGQVARLPGGLFQRLQIA